MGKTKKTPELRFKGFEEEWEDFRLGRLGTTQSGIGFPDNEQGGCIGVPFFKVSDMNNEGNEHEMISSNNYVTDEQMARRNWKPITQVPALIFAKVGAALMLNRKRLVRCPFFIDNNSMAYIFGSSWITYFGKVYFDTIKLPLYAQIGALPSYNGSDIENIEVRIPSNKKEQTKVGSFFQNLDALIALHQRKHDKLCTVKRAMLEKMFPKEGTDVPEIRFKGFAGKWERRKYYKVFTIISNNTLSRADLNYNSGIAKNIHYGDVLIKFGELLDIEKATIPFITNNCFAEKLRSSILQNGDLIIADTAEDETVGKCTELINTNGENIVSGLHTIPSRPTLFFALGYLGYFMNSFTYHHQLLRLMQGTKVLSISKSVLQDTNIYYPNSIGEQSKIADFFQHLDSFISLHQRELDKLKNIKKACLDKMFV